MLTAELIEQILARLPALGIGVVGDLFLDQYLDLDPALSEPSLETGLDAYQIVRVRHQPGAAGTVLNNLAALGVGRPRVLSILGRDANGFALKQALAARGIEMGLLIEAEGRHTPTYCKPMLGGRELNRLDLKNRIPTPPALEKQVIDALPRLWRQVDALLVVDQVSEANCGVVTDRVREELMELGMAEPGKLLLVDSRERIADFSAGCTLKFNLHEAGKLPGTELQAKLIRRSSSTGRPVICTRGEKSTLVVQSAKDNPTAALGSGVTMVEVPAFPVAGPTDIVGAGDSFSASLACAFAAGFDLPRAAAFGNLVASITIQQVGTTGTASPEQVRQRWQEVLQSR